MYFESRYVLIVFETKAASHKTSTLDQARGGTRSTHALPGAAYEGHESACRAKVDYELWSKPDESHEPEAITRRFGARTCNALGHDPLAFKQDLSAAQTVRKHPLFTF